MREAIKNFAKQFGYRPEVINEERLEEKKKFVFVGMGGSSLAASLLRVWNPLLDLVIHRNYGLPHLGDLEERLVVPVSHSGNTEEVLDAFTAARKRGLAIAAVSTGGKLIEQAKKESASYIEMPGRDIQPRLAVGFHFRALLKLIGDERALGEAAELYNSFKPEELEGQGKELAKTLKNSVPVIYSSERNKPLAYNWKVRLNETGKIPAFHNVFPELGHNEIIGFGEGDTSLKLPEHFYFLFLRDDADDPRILKRMEVLKDIYEKRNLRVEVVKVAGENVFHKIFSSIVLADWASFYTAQAYGLDPEAIALVEEFKQRIKDEEA